MKADMMNRAVVRGLLICAAVATSLAWVEDNADAANTGDTNSADGKNDAVAIVTEVRGTAEVQSEKSVVKASVLTEFLSGARVELQAGAKLVALYLTNGDQYEFTGPALFQCGDHAPASISATAPLKLRSMVGKDGTPIPIRPAGTTLPAIAARRALGKPVPALSMAGTVTLERSPVFRWKAVERGLEYKFVLKDDGGSALFSQSIKGDFLELPEQVGLQDGESYVWSIGTRSGMGQNYLSEYSFKTADEATRAAVENYRPAGDAPVAERVAFAVWLDQMGLRDAGSAQWKSIADAGSQIPEGRLAPPK
jgi:hypothetical protein